jgi:hypothetical protein
MTSRSRKSRRSSRRKRRWSTKRDMRDLGLADESWSQPRRAGPVPKIRYSRGLGRLGAEARLLHAEALQNLNFPPLHQGPIGEPKTPKNAVSTCRELEYHTTPPPPPQPNCTAAALRFCIFGEATLSCIKLSPTAGAILVGIEDCQLAQKLNNRLTFTKVANNLDGTVQ